MPDIKTILGISPVIPVAVIPRATDAVSIARALLSGGISIIEVTLRTPEALAAIENIRREVKDVCVGAGTVWTAQEASDAIDAGAQFLVSPGRSDAAYKVCVERNIPYLPGVQTVSEIAYWHDKKLSAVKFFPAEVAGGISALKAFGAVFPNMKFCPTGGISATTATNYLNLPNVPCIGGSWLLVREAVQSRNWTYIEELAHEACHLGQRPHASGGR